MSNEREVLTDDLFGTATREQVADTGPPSLIKADHVWRRTERWIDVPWSVLPPVVDPDALAH